MGLYFGTNGVGFSVGSRGGCGAVLGGIVLFGTVIWVVKALLVVWYVTLPVALLVFGVWAVYRTHHRRNAVSAAEERALVLLRRKTRGRDFATEQKQAAVSNRR